MDLSEAVKAVHDATLKDSHENLIRSTKERPSSVEAYEAMRTFSHTEAALRALLKAAWEEGYDAGEADMHRSHECAKRGGPVSDCDCQVPTTNPYEED